MSDTGFLIMMLWVTLAHPLVALSGVFVGLLSRRWLHVPLALGVAPVAYWLFYATFYRPPPGFDLMLALYLSLGGLIWGAAVFGLRRATFAL